MQNRHAALERETLFAGVTGIEEEHAADGFAKGLVRVAEHDGIGPFARNAVFEFVGERMRVHDVMQKEFAPADFREFGELQIEPRVSVAEHCRHGRDGFEFEQQRVRPHIASVQDVFDTGEERRDFRIEKTVGV
jgi:hypothetical protein